MTDQGVVMIVLGGFTAAALTIRGIASTVLRFQENKLKHSTSGLHGATDARLERLEHAIDSIAIEIERISEGQRFTTKLLSERTLPSHKNLAS